MNEPQVELNELKQEVAELWTRFRKESPPVVDEDGRRALAELYRGQEAKRRALAEQRSLLRHELEAQRRRASRFAPAVRFLGSLVGVAASAVAVRLFGAELAEVSLLLAPAHGAAVLTSSLVVLAVALGWGD